MSLFQINSVAITKRFAYVISAIVLSAAATIPFFDKVLAVPPSLYFSQQNIMASGSDLYVQVRANSGSELINAVQADFTYSTGLLSFVSIDANNSAFEVDANSTESSGLISIQRASATTKAGDFLVATVRFTVIGVGTANFAFQNSSVLAQPCGVACSQDVLNETVDANIQGVTGPLVPIYRIGNIFNSQRVYTTSKYEHDYAIAHYPGWVSEGTFYGVPNGTPGSKPVYRIGNIFNSQRVFTDSLSERDYAIAHYPGWVSEGTFYGMSSSVAGTVPVYRIGNIFNSQRVYTTSKYEHDYAIAHYPGWVSEGITFYASP
jgi:hypothetical protein